MASAGERSRAARHRSGPQRILRCAAIGTCHRTRTDTKVHIPVLTYAPTKRVRLSQYIRGHLTWRAGLRQALQMLALLQNSAINVSEHHGKSCCIAPSRALAYKCCLNGNYPHRHLSTKTHARGVHSPTLAGNAHAYHTFHQQQHWVCVTPSVGFGNLQSLQCLLLADA